MLYLNLKLFTNTKIKPRDKFEGYTSTNYNWETTQVCFAGCHSNGAILYFLSQFLTFLITKSLSCCASNEDKPAYKQLPIARNPLYFTFFLWHIASWWLWPFHDDETLLIQLVVPSLPAYSLACTYLRLDCSQHSFLMHFFTWIRILTLISIWGQGPRI